MAAYYVYELIDPRSGRVFYVGKGQGNRIDAHEAEARKGRVSRKCDHIREIEAAGAAVGRRKILHTNDEAAAYECEANRIDELGLANLSNVMPGGGGRNAAPSLFGDRNAVRAISDFVARTRNGEINKLYVFGDVIDLLPILDEFKSKVSRIIRRRGLEWVNAIAITKRAEFHLLPFNNSAKS